MVVEAEGAGHWKGSLVTIGVSVDEYLRTGPCWLKDSRGSFSGSALGKLDPN